MRYLIIVFTMITVSCTTTGSIGNECNEILQEEYLNTQHQVKQRHQDMTLAARVEEDARSKCEKAIHAHQSANTRDDFRPACREEQRANIALQDRLTKLQEAYYNAYTELGKYNPKCTNNDEERNAAAKQRESYKDKQKTSQAKINTLKERYSYIGGQFVTQDKEPGSTPTPKAATAKPENLISNPPSASTRRDSTTTP